MRNTNNTTLKKSAVKHFVDGYVKANKFIQDEKRKRLRKLSSEESLREYDELCKTWALSDATDNLKELDRERIRSLLARRRDLNRAGTR